MPKSCLMEKKGLLFDLQQGLVRERQARSLCKELLPLLESEEKAPIIQIIKDETEHIKITKNLINIVKKYYEK